MCNKGLCRRIISPYFWPICQVTVGRHGGQECQPTEAFITHDPAPFNTFPTPSRSQYCYCISFECCNTMHNFNCCSKEFQLLQIINSQLHYFIIVIIKLYVFLQLLSCLLCPHFVDDPNYPRDIKEKAQRILEAKPGFSIGELQQFTPLQSGKLVLGFIVNLSQG